MNLKDIENDLRAKRDQIIISLGLLTVDKNQKNGPLTQDLDEQSIVKENDEVVDALDILDRMEIKKIDDALIRIKNGNYGTCSECGAEIQDKRLKALPYAATCIDCASEYNNIYSIYSI